MFSQLNKNWFMLLIILCNHIRKYIYKENISITLKIFVFYIL